MLAALTIDELLVAARAGDSLALGEAFGRESHLLSCLATGELRMRCPTACGSEDLVQDCFLDAVRGFATFRGVDGPSWHAWLVEILRHNCLNHSRPSSLARQPKRLDSAFGFSQGTASRAVGPCEQAESNDQDRVLSETMELIPHAMQAVIRERLWKGQSFPDIADSLGCSSALARKRFGRAVDALRVQLSVGNWGGARGSR